MKNLIALLFCLSPLVCLSQNIEATTKDGRKVILKPNKTWEYDPNSSNTSSNCNLSANHVEPKTDKATYDMLKQFGATTDDLKKHVSVENECGVNDIILIAVSEQMGNGMYVICVKGTKMKYKRTGSVFSKSE
jgi:hypothetical protein